MVLCLHYALQQNVTGACYRIALLWCVSIVCGVIAQISVMLMCNNKHLHYLWLYQTTLCLIFFVLPILFASFTYKKMCVELLKPVEGKVSNEGMLKSMNQRHLTARKVSVLLLSFVVLLLPF